MKKICLRSAALFVAASLVFGGTEAAIPSNSAGSATLSVMAVSTNSKSTFATCRNTLQNCLVTLTILPPNEGFVIIQNTSDVDAINVRAILPGEFSDVSQTSICELLKAHESCSLVFRASSSNSQPHPETTIPVKGDNTGTIFFDMRVLELGGA